MHKKISAILVLFIFGFTSPSYGEDIYNFYFAKSQEKSEKRNKKRQPDSDSGSVSTSANQVWPITGNLF